MDLSLRTALPAGAVFVVFSDGSESPSARTPGRYLACKGFAGHKPNEAVELSLRAPSGEGEIGVYLNNPRNRNRSLFGRLKVNLSPASAPHLQVSETDEHQLKVCLENCEVRALPASSAVPATSSPVATVPVVLTLSTPMPDGAVFIEWSGAEDSHALVVRSFIEHLPAEPIEVPLEAPPGPGAFTVSLTSGNARTVHVSGPIKTTLALGDTPRLIAVEPAGKPGDEHFPMLQVSLEGALRSP